MDASYVVALASEADQNYAKALQLADFVVAEHPTVWTTHAVVLEVTASLARLKHRSTCVVLLSGLFADPLVRVLPVTDELFTAGWELYSARPDKEWSLTDCISFEVMTRRGLRQALTADHHFEQAGFAALLRAAP